MRARFHAGTLMEKAKGQATATEKEVRPGGKAAEADRRVELWESLREVEVAIPEP